MSLKRLLAVAATAASLGGVYAKLDLSSPSNVAVYWGQNSFRGTGNLAQQRLSYYCDATPDPKIDILELAFLTKINGEAGVPEIDFSNANDNCTTFKDTNLKKCPQIGEDIATCQKKGKTVLLSIGGATYSEGGFNSDSTAKAGAELVWQTFGPPSINSTARRPFGNATVDGFDFDFEAAVTNMAPFASRLRELMDADHSRQYFLTAAPQCPYPDAADKDILNGPVSIDAIFVQFYNNWCGLNSFEAGASQQNNFNFDTWDNWAKTVSQNKQAKVFLGVPANTGAAGSGYVSSKDLGPIIEYSKKFGSFGGVMMWDVTQAYGNKGFLDDVVEALGKTASRVRRSLNYRPYGWF
ncbi:glycoside hydrolase family 18 protein [Aspergillus clavatus NRRL 1]|uniref:chitinase n=1 Tax=Aspergillus clavatus (strain ATCC 1007 / CBS 513.65 / DSM 816 / NCTC 3887 / NRRL 1 / QM 1276 / 107) TaxID=344612 RepID=A1C4Y5_ASPCL|nr:class III chitinase, putative [Aspergillus clavatus NRRL 1]EAW14753.1 class III chitinase, putative [Aspergillus clavatus NRRL 1]